MSTVPRIALMVLVALAATLAGMWIARARAPAPQAALLEHATVFGAARVLPEVALVDQDGLAFGTGRLRGRWSILFFGFTHCPDVCPTTLATLAAARRALSDLPADEQPAVVLVSVDPGRDTPARLAEYVRFFDASFTGVTGEPAALDALQRALGVAVLAGEPDGAGNYTIDHTATLFLVNPEAALVAVFGLPHTADGIAHDYRQVVGAAVRGSR